MMKMMKSYKWRGHFSRIQCQYGFSLIEILIALLLISIALLGSFRLQADLEKQSEYAVRIMEAMNIAEAALEWCEVRNMEPDLNEWYQVSLLPTGVMVSWLDRHQESQELQIRTLKCANTSSF